MRTRLAVASLLVAAAMVFWWTSRSPSGERSRSSRPRGPAGELVRVDVKQRKTPSGPPLSTDLPTGALDMLRHERPFVVEVADEDGPVRGAVVSLIEHDPSRRHGVDYDTPVWTDGRGRATWFLPTIQRATFRAVGPRGDRSGVSLPTLPGERARIRLAPAARVVVSVVGLDPRAWDSATVLLYRKVGRERVLAARAPLGDGARTTFDALEPGAYNAELSLMGQYLLRSFSLRAAQSKLVAFDAAFSVVRFDVLDTAGERPDQIVVRHSKIGPIRRRRSADGLFTIVRPRGLGPYEIRTDSGELTIVTFEEGFFKPGVRLGDVSVIQLEAGASVVGKVTGLVSSMYPVRVELTYEAGTHGHSRPIRRTTVSDGQGAFAFDRLAPGRMCVVTAAVPPEYFVRPKHARTRGPGTTFDVNLEARKASVLEIRFEDSVEAPLPGVLVKVELRQFARVGEGKGAVSLRRFAQTRFFRSDAKGVVRIPALRGSSVVCVYSHPGHTTFRDVMHYVDWDGVRRTVFALHRSRNVVGAVCDGTGQPVSGAEIRALTVVNPIEGAPTLLDTTTTDRDGRFVVRIDGRYDRIRIEAIGSDGRGATVWRKGYEGDVVIVAD